jgi:hypothetical protein
MLFIVGVGVILGYPAVALVAWRTGGASRLWIVAGACVGVCLAATFPLVKYGRTDAATVQMSELMTATAYLAAMVLATIALPIAAASAVVQTTAHRQWGEPMRYGVAGLAAFAAYLAGLVGLLWAYYGLR